MIGIDLGGTKIEIALVDPAKGVIYKSRVPTPQHAYNAILDSLCELVNRTIREQKIQLPPSIGIGIPGCSDPATNLIRGSNTVVMNGKPLQQDLQQRLGCQIHLQNDANCLAVSEAVDGAAKGYGVVFAVIIGTGCGGGIAINGKAWTGKNGIAGEWGHNPLPWPSAEEIQVEACWCGQVGCQETWISGSAFALDYARHTGDHIKAEAIIDKMRAGELEAKKCFDRYINRLARALASVINLIDPDAIVLGGGMSNIDEIYQALPREIIRYTFTKPIATPVLKAMHGDSSGVRGAAWLSN